MADKDKGTAQSTEEKIKVFDAWLEKQADDIKKTVTDFVQGLRNAYDRTKDELKQSKETNDTLRTELTGIVKQKDSDATAQVEQFKSKLDEAERRSLFYEAIAGKGVKNAKLAYVAAREGGFLENMATFSVDKFKEGFGELFAEPAAATEQNTNTANTATGGGTGGAGGDVNSMTWNDALRSLAGVRQ